MKQYDTPQDRGGTGWKSHSGGANRLAGRTVYVLTTAKNPVARLALNALSARALSRGGPVTSHCQLKHTTPLAACLHLLGALTPNIHLHCTDCPLQALNSTLCDIFTVLQVPKHIFHLGPLRDTGLTPRSSYSWLGLILQKWDRSLIIPQRNSQMSQVSLCTFHPISCLLTCSERASHSGSHWETSYSLTGR